MEFAPEEVTDEERRQAKAVNFGAAYGSGPQGLVNYFQSIGQLISLEEGEAFLKAWIDAFPRIAAWHNVCRDLVKAGQPVIMVDGRRSYLYRGEAHEAHGLCQQLRAGQLRFSNEAGALRHPPEPAKDRPVGSAGGSHP